MCIYQCFRFELKTRGMRTKAIHQMSIGLPPGLFCAAQLSSSVLFETMWCRPWIVEELSDITSLCYCAFFIWQGNAEQCRTRPRCGGRGVRSSCSLMRSLGAVTSIQHRVVKGLGSSSWCVTGSLYFSEAAPLGENSILSVVGMFSRTSYKQNTVSWHAFEVKQRV